MWGSIGQRCVVDLIYYLKNMKNNLIKVEDGDLRMQGQNAYNMGHEYCVSHLVNCAYATQNMRDVYRSEIAGDCSRYEKSLNKLKTALESALETYSE